MADYISRETALEIVKRTSGDYAAAFSEIRKLPATNVEPVRYELVQAEKEGRLLILPCKPGCTLYEIWNNTDACLDCDDYQMYAQCCGIRPVRYDYPLIAKKPVCDKQFLEICEITLTAARIVEYLDKFGDTIFLTRESAEAAFENVKNKLEGPKNEV